jgi:DNA-binding SARP family transcriptional activator
MHAPPSLALRLLGPPAVLVDGAPAAPDVLWRKHLALLCYLALSPHMARSRAHLQALLWSEKDAEHARHSLNEAVRRLRAGLGSERVPSHADSIALDERDLTVDVLERAALEQQAELLEGFSLPDAAAFDEWLEAERVALRQGRVAYQVDEARRALTAQRFDDALHRAQRALGLDPLAEPAVAVAMRAAALRSDRATALRTYREFADRLAATLGTRPGRDLEALAQRIDAGVWRAAARPATKGSPLAGRTELHARVFEIVRSALGGCPAVVALAGGSGFGKSRLLDEIADRWRLEGGTAGLARPVEEDRTVPWSTLRELFRAGLARAPGLPATAPEALGLLASLVPGLPVRDAPRPPSDIAEAGTALRALIRALAEEAPLAILLDDAELADGHTVAALHAALSALMDLPLLVVVACGTVADTAPELTRLVSRISRELPGTALTLTPLDPPATRALVDELAPWCANTGQQARLARRLQAETGGNPLLLVTLLRGLADVASLREDALVWPPPAETLESPVPDEVPRLAQLVTLARVRQLDASSRAFLISACVGGRVVDPAISRALSSLDETEAERALTDLERRGFLAFDGARYVFPAPLVARIVASGLLTPGERHRLEARRAALLRGRARGGD